MAGPVTSHNNVLINRIMAMLEPVFSGAAQAHTATYRANSELQPELGLKTLLVTGFMILKKDKKSFFETEGVVKETDTANITTGYKQTYCIYQ